MLFLIPAIWRPIMVWAFSLPLAHDSRAYTILAIDELGASSDSTPRVDLVPSKWPRLQVLSIIIGIDSLVHPNVSCEEMPYFPVANPLNAECPI